MEEVQRRQTVDEVFKTVRMELSKQSQLLADNDRIINELSSHKGIVMQTTIDFQKSCVAILNR